MSLKWIVAFLLSSSACFAGAKTGKSYLDCDSSGWFKLMVYPDLGLIEVYDKGQERISTLVTKLRFTDEQDVVKAYNDFDVDLPLGLIFEADLNKKNMINAYSVDDHSLRKTHFVCERKARIID